MADTMLLFLVILTTLGGLCAAASFGFLIWDLRRELVRLEHA